MFVLPRFLRPTLIQPAAFGLVAGAGLLLSGQAQAQNTLRITVRDSASHAPLVGASVGLPGTSTGGQTDANGTVSLTPPPPAGAVLSIEALGYRPRRLRLSGPDAATVLLAPAAEQIAEVVVTATRTNSRLEDAPTRVEVLGEEEMREENGIKPGNIASLLGDIAGTQIQPTSPTTGNADLRIQGLQGRYSQILRDGLPLLGGYAGGFGILQIPPLDLRQIELIKGSSSTLYGGGAIAGLVNLVSRTPTQGTPQYSLTVNQSTLRESNLNGFAAARTRRFGYTLYGGLTRQQAVDVDGDGYVDVPRLLNATVHPRLFWYPGAHGQLALGYTGTAESRRGGDAQRLRDGAASTGHEYFVTNLLRRHTLDATYTQDSLGGGSLTLKGTVSTFGRQVRTNTVGFDARQLSYFGEANYLRRLGPHHTLVAGLSLSGEQLRPDAGSFTPLLARYSYATVGAFAQDDWQVHPRLNVQAGLRLDRHNQYGAFLLPRLALLYKASPALTFRLNGGAGYRAPVPYVNDLDEREYPLVRPLNNLRPERSLGLNGDVNWSHAFGPEVHLTLNQGFFYTRLHNPSTLEAEPGRAPLLSWRSQARPVVSQGLETYLRLEADETELYLGYVFTDARRHYDPVNPHVELAARHKLSTVVVQEFSERWGAGVEASYTGRQYLDDGELTPGYPIVALLLRYRTGPWTVVLNGENLLDYRQTRREAVVRPPADNPVFRPLWAPVEGRVVNLSVNWRFQARP